MSNTLSQKCRALLAELHLISADTKITVQPLSGGVASDIARIDTDNSTWCVKFALPKLKVEADWFAPTHRNMAEYNWLSFAAETLPHNAIRLFGFSDTLQGFAMAYLEAEDIYLYKNALLTGTDTGTEAGKIGKLIGTIHNRSATPEFDDSGFHNQDDFWALRIEPYLCYTATRHPEISKSLLDMADRLYHADRILVHGDVSPKNIFLRAAEPVILDAECATMGDPCFDISFFLNHLVLKAIHMPHRQTHNLRAVMDFWDSYHPFIAWEAAEELERRTCQLLPALMLARVDGKSPVEYLHPAQQHKTREIALKMIKSPYANLNDFCHNLGEHLS